MKKTAPQKVGKIELSPKQVMDIGRTLRRWNRKSRDLMKLLGVDENSVRIPRKKRRGKAETAPEATEPAAS
jgi:hypothetical protein